MSLDDDGYPTDDSLLAIEKWPFEKGHRALMQQVRSIWTYADCGFWNEFGTDIHISTGGWSGNESIVGALQRNYLFWGLCWESSRRGGHHQFTVKH